MDGDYEGYAEWREWWREREGALSEKLRDDVVKQKPGKGDFSYVEGWHVIAEANRIFGFGNWSRESVFTQETNRDLMKIKAKNGEEYQQWRVGYIAKVRITVASVVREGTGYGSGMAKPEAVGDAVEKAIKEAETDAMKRAMMTFGNPFGLALYDKEKSNVGKTDAQLEEEAEKNFQRLKADLERFAAGFIRTLNTVDSVERIQSGINKHRETLDSIKRDFPDIDANLQREIEKTRTRVAQNA